MPAGWVRWAYLPLLVSLFAGVFILYLIDSGVGSDPRAEGALLPLLVRASAALLPASVLDGLGRLALVGGDGGTGLPGIRIAADAPADTLLLYGWIGAFLLAFTLTVEPFFRETTGLGFAWTRLVPFAALAGLPLFFVGSSPGDLPMLALTTLCLLLMARRRWAAYGIALAAAALNRETAVLFPLVFALHFGSGGRMERRRFWPLLLGQAALVLLVQGGAAAALPGPTDGMTTVQRWGTLAGLLRSYRMETAVAWIAVALAAVSEWRDKPFFLKAAAGMVLPLWATFALVGFPREMRLACELYPAALCLVLYAFVKKAETGALPAMPTQRAGAPEPS